MFYSNKEWYYFLANICIIPRNLNYEKNIDGALSVICINSFFNAFLKVSVFWKSNIIKLNSRLQFSIMFKRLRCGFRQTWICFLWSYMPFLCPSNMTERGNSGHYHREYWLLNDDVYELFSIVLRHVGTQQIVFL